MHTLDRDYRVMSLVARFQQLSTPQISALVFPGQASRTSCDRALQRMVGAGLLELVESHRRGGAGVNVYQLGREGWPLFFTGRRNVQKVVRPHALAVADVFVQVTAASRAGWLDILEWQVEADAWVAVAGAEIRPDLLLDVGLPDKKERVTLWLEVDLGGERQKQIVEKLDRYIYAYNHAEALPGRVFPQIVFLTTSDHRRQELSSIIARQKDMPEGLVTVELLESFPQSLQ